jgi:hypothetical protein
MIALYIVRIRFLDREAARQISHCANSVYYRQGHALNPTNKYNSKLATIITYVRCFFSNWSKIDIFGQISRQGSIKGGGPRCHYNGYRCSRHQRIK